MLSTAQSNAIRSALERGTLRVRSMSPDGRIEWKRVLHVCRSEVGAESILKVHTTVGSSVMTGGHRVFTSPTTKTEAENLICDRIVAGIGSPRILSIEKLPPRQHMYDLTAEDWHNFILHRSGMLVSNSPDRNYHFRPPAHEETVGQFNRVFGFIWEDYELAEYIDRGLDMVIAYPPRTPFPNIDSMVQMKPEWKTLVLTAAKMLALDALRINWIADEFDYSIGGVSLNIDKASKYESAAQAAGEQFDKQIEKAKATINIILGLQQPKFGGGIRSSFGPYVGAGVLTPAKFSGF